MKTFKINSNDAGRTVLKYVEKMLNDVPKSKIEKLFRNKDVKLNDKRIKDKSILLTAGDVLVIYNIYSDPQKVIYKPISQNFKVVYEDKNILVVSKKEGTIVSSDENSLDNQIWNYLKFKQDDSFIPSSIGRLDKVTSGIIVYAKNYHTLRYLKEQQKHFIKYYIFKSDLPKSITTNFKINHDEMSKREVCGSIGKLTTTIFTVNDNKKIAQILTGRKHQIRASLSKLGYPIYGDRKYGGKPAQRVFIHSYSIKFQELANDLKYLNEVEIMDHPKW